MHRRLFRVALADRPSIDYRTAVKESIGALTQALAAIIEGRFRARNARD